LAPLDQDEGPAASIGQQNVTSSTTATAGGRLYRKHAREAT